MPFPIQIVTIIKTKKQNWSDADAGVEWCPLEMLMFNLVSASAMDIYFLQNWLWFASSLHFSVSCSLYADDLAIWSSSPLVCTVVEVTQGALF